MNILRSTTVDKVIPVVNHNFGMFGYPEQVKTDNGPQFRSNLWRNYLKSCGIGFRKITPLWPRSNSQDVF